MRYLRPGEPILSLQALKWMRTWLLWTAEVVQPLRVLFEQYMEANT